MCLKSDEYIQLCLQRTANMAEKTNVQTLRGFFSAKNVICSLRAK